MVFTQNLIVMLHRFVPSIPKSNFPLSYRSTALHVSLRPRYHHDDPQRRCPLMVMGDHLWGDFRSWSNTPLVFVFFDCSHTPTQREPDTPLALSKCSPTHRTTPACRSRDRYIYRMDTRMIHTRRSFALSLAFHAMMGTVAFWLLSQMNPPPHIERIPFKIMSVSPAEHRVSLPIPPSLSPMQHLPVSQNIPTPAPTIARALPDSIPTPVASPSVPIASPAQIPAAKPLTPLQPAAVVAPKLEVKPDTATEKRHFLAALRSTIQNNLHYPPAARRRGMQGEVAVRFTLNEGGSIGTINILDGESIFHNAAKAAVASASGVNIPKNLAETLPLEIDLTLEFTLKSDG